MIIELQEEIDSFLKNYIDTDIIIIPVFCDIVHHPANNVLSFLFIKFLKKNEYYILPFNHNECINLPVEFLNKLNTDNKKYVFNKKEFLHIFHLKNLIDINLLYYINANKNDEVTCTTELIVPQSYSLVKKNFSNAINIGKSLPILQYYDNLVSISNKLESIINNNYIAEQESAFGFLNINTIECLYNIEKEGLCIDRSLVGKFFSNIANQISINNNIHTQYNIYTLTGRPSNKFSNINFAALKYDGERECFISRFGECGELLLFDYDAYHLRLMADIVNYKFPDNIHIHEYLGKIYFGKAELTEEEYNESKRVSFEILYGGIDESVSKEIPFFGFIKKYIDNIWKLAQECGYAETIISKKKLLLKNFDTLNKNKLFNYILQNYETESNILVMRDIQSFLISNNYKSKLILYLYDGFLFDIHADDIDILPKIKSILQCNGKYPVKTYKGKNFQNMVKIE